MAKSSVRAQICSVVGSSEAKTHTIDAARVLQLFHPTVADWFRDCVGEPTTPQLRGWPAIARGEHTLIAAPTGSGKTLTAFLASLNDLFLRRERGELEQQTYVLYISPLKALSADVEKNLAGPLAELRTRFTEDAAAEIEVGLRTGDTEMKVRARMAKRPPHILVTTPESLYLLLTSDSGRRMLRTARTVIVDEIHALIASKRGSHLALSLARLDALVHEHGGVAPQRIGLSATQKPIEEVARFLVGPNRETTIVDVGHVRTLDLELELPRSELGDVTSHGEWKEIYNRLTELVESHTSTLIFVGTRRLAERIGKELQERLGQEHVLSHHGSLSKELRLSAEDKLKKGQLKCLVATASLELGIDVGAVDLVCQIGSPRSIAVFLQRVGRSGHFVKGTPKGRLFPTSRDDLVECIALLRATRAKQLDCIREVKEPLDVLAQQIVAEVACRDWNADELYAQLRQSWPYRDLARTTFDEVSSMLAQGFTTRRGRRSAYLHVDEVHGVQRARKGAKLTAIGSGGAIPDTADYAVQLEPEGIRVGTIHEDFAIESQAGDIFQLGNKSWKILRVSAGVVHVEDAKGSLPTIPFWIGEAPARTDELSEYVLAFFAQVEARFAAEAIAAEDADRAIRAYAQELAESAQLPEEACFQALFYLHTAYVALGALPTANRIVSERFFDEAGNMHVVLHTRRGARLNRAWGLALRKSFCRSFNFELQAAATDDAIVLSLGPTHSFPASDVFAFLRSATVEKVLTQAVLDAPIFGIRWRWAATIALAIPRRMGAKKTPPPIQRMLAEDLLALVFPDAQACLENIPGDREIPDHPLTRQALADVLGEALDGGALTRMLREIEAGNIETIARDLTAPSPLAASILGARPYAFLDDAPLEERRTQAVQMRRFLDAKTAQKFGALDEQTIDAVKDDAWPDPRDREEAHDALVVHAFLTEAEVEGRGAVLRKSSLPWMVELAHAGRAFILEANENIWVSAERLSEVVHALWDGDAFAQKCADVHARIPEKLWYRGTRETAQREVLRGRLEALGPVTAEVLAAPLNLRKAEIESTLAALESEGFAMRGSFSPRAAASGMEEWCDRRLLARIHQGTLKKLRSAIEPCSTGDLMRFYLFHQRANPDYSMNGLEGVMRALTQLEGIEAPLGAWESSILPARVRDFAPHHLDELSQRGFFAWLRIPRSKVGGGRAQKITRATPVMLVRRERLPFFADLLKIAEPQELLLNCELSANAQRVGEVLFARGALFFDEIVRAGKLPRKDAEDALSELLGAGVATCDLWAGVRSFITPLHKRTVRHSDGSRSNLPLVASVDIAGRWSLVRIDRDDSDVREDHEKIEEVARLLLLRWGVVIREVLEKESDALPPWRELVRVFHRMEARGDVHGGRFVALHSGEQFAYPEAAQMLRAIRNQKVTRGDSVTVSAADPLALVGVVVPGERVPAVEKNVVVLNAPLDQVARP